MVKRIVLFIGAGITAAWMVARAGEPPREVHVMDSIADQSLGEVVVTGRSARDRVSAVQIGAERLELSRLASTPALFGENDIIKSISLMPGVHSEGEGAGGFEVRGGTSAQNLVTLDGATLYNPTHVMGIFSTFNDDALGRATLYKGPIPASYGGAHFSRGLFPRRMETRRLPCSRHRWHRAIWSLSMGWERWGYLPPKSRPRGR